MGTMPGGQRPAERNAGLDAGLAWATANLLMADTTGDTPLTERSTSTNATPLPAIPAPAGIHGPMPDTPHSHRTTPMPEHPDFFEQRHSAPYPEPSTAAGRRLDIRRPASLLRPLRVSTVCTIAELRSPIRHLRRNLAAVLLGLPLFFGLATEAAQAQVLISNIGQQTSDTFNNLVTDYAQAFTTGSHKQGYTVSGVDMVLQENNLNDLFRKRNPRLTVTIREESSGIPGTIVGTLNLPASSPTFTSNQTFTFTAPAKGIQLSPSTTYFVVIDVDASRSTNNQVDLRMIISDDENAGGAAGFSIANKPLIWAWYETPPKWENLSGGATSIEMSVKGELNPITDLIQMKNATRRIAEFGAPKSPDDEDSLRVIVDIGDGLSPQGRRRVKYTVGGTAILGTDYKIDGCTSSPCTSIFRANQHSLIIPIDVINDDLDENDENIIITLQDGTGYTVNKSKRTATVTITDDDTRGLVFYRRWPDVDEGGSETFTVKLRSQPTAPVTVNIASNNQDVTVDTDKTMPGNQNTLSFTPTDWNTAQTVTVSAAQDDDAVDDTATLTYTPSGGDYGGANALSIDRPVSVDDDETRTTTGPQLPRISLTGGAAVTEGAAASFMVNADPAPTARLTVNVEVFDGLSGQDFVAASQEGVRTVTLNAGATSTTFTVLTVDDNTDEDDGFVTVFVNDGTGYNAGQGSVVTVRDNDGPAPPSASFAAESSSVAEDGGTHNVPVNLSQAAPSGGLTLGYIVAGTATEGSGNDFTIQGSGSLTIPAGTTTADIPVAINDDSTQEGAETVILTLTGGTGYTLGSPRIYTLTITDNDAPPATPGLVISRSTLRVTEGGTGSYMVSLATEPTGTVTVNIASNNTDVTVSPAPLTFHASGGSSPWNTAQTVTVSAGQDNDADDDSATLTHTASGGGYDSVATASVTVTVDDDETPPLPPVASFTSASSSVAEDDGTHNVTVNLSVVAPSGGLTLRYSVTGTATATAGSGNDFTIQNSGTVSVGAGATTATIPVVINDDSTDENAETVILTLTSGTGYRLGSTRVHTLTITDNDDPLPDTPGLVIDSVLVPVSEGGTGSYMVSLSTEPTGTVTVTIASDNTDVTVSPASLTFHASGGSSPWNTAQTVTVSAGQDTDADDDSATLTHTASGGGYGNVPEASVTITVDDDETPQPVASFATASSSAAEDDGTYNVTVNLSVAAPSGGLTLAYSVAGTATAVSGHDFTIQNSGMVAVVAGETTATIPVAILDDSRAESAETVILMLTDGMGYRLGSTTVHTLTITDNDKGLVISKNELSVTEGGTGSYMVSLATEPTGTVTVTIASDNTDVTVSPASLTFHASGGSSPWNTAQTVTVSAGQDPDADDDSATLTHTASGGGYGNVPEASVTVTVDDDGTTPTPPPTAPTPVVSISAGVPSVTEGDAISFTLSATPPPEAGTTITVTVNVAEGGSVAASGETGGRQVAISTSGMASFIVATDDDAIYEPDGSITATVQAGAGYRPHSSNASAAVSVKDNDPGLELSTGHLRVSKGGSISYTIALATQPSDPVRVSISGHEATGLTVDVASLDFTPANWDVPQEVTLTAPGKAASITLTHTATGGNYGGIEAEVVVTVIALDPKARQGWLSRFGRTVSHQVVEGIQGRFAAPPSPPGLHLTVAGEALSSTTPLAENQQVLSKALGFETVTTHQLVEGSSFSFAPSADGAPAQFAIWGQGALASFSGAEESLSLDGDVSTALLGAEWSGARWLAGAALSHSWGNGSYAEDNTVAGGDISSSTLTGIFPYGRYRLTPRLGIWAITGYGWGDLTLKPDGDSADYSPGTTMVMTAVGIDGLLLDGGAEGLSLTTTADALTVQTTSEAVADLASSDANITRLRLGLEATRPVPLANGASLLPSLELGIRQDRGDAETGFGMELGAGLVWTDSGRGISAALKGRTLLTHTDEAFQEQGLAVSFAWEPSPSNRGPSFSVSHAVGATAEGGMDALLSPTALEALDATPSRHHQFETKLAYGFPAFNDRLTLTPGLGWALSPDSRTYSLLWALAPYTQQPQAEPWEISLEGERQEDNAADSSVEHSLKLRFSLPF